KTSVTNRPKGLPATTRVQRYYKELVFRYLTERILIGYHPETKDPIYKLGVWRIPDIGLLKELLLYSDVGGNFDRYVAFGHTLAHEAWADKIYPIVSVPKQEKSEYEQKVDRNIIR